MQVHQALMQSARITGRARTRVKAPQEFAMRRDPAANRSAAWFVVTFVLVLGGVGTAVLAGSTVGAVGVSLAFGLALLAMVYAAAAVVLLVVKGAPGAFDLQANGLAVNGF